MILLCYFDQVGYHYVPSGKPYPDNWIITDIIYETEGGQLQSRLNCASFILFVVFCYFISGESVSIVYA